MKYGIVLHNFGDRAVKEGSLNIGDPIQSIALEQIYKENGISKDDILKINLCELETYEGEYVLLPMLGVAIGINFTHLPLSPKIIPVFISAHFASSELTADAIDYLKLYSPIGCRDEFSLQTMRRYGIPAYISGCITVTFDKREQYIKGDKIFLIDIPKSLIPHLPSEIYKNAFTDTHLLPLPDKIMTRDEAENLYQLSSKRLQLYKNQAKLVISSRMHALVPCMAMGIPVIAVFENISQRFSWLDKYIKLYSEDEFSTIDWNPESIDFEKTKNTVKSLIFEVIQSSYKKYRLMYEVSHFYEDRKRALYGNRYYKILQSLEFPNDNFDYIIWGCGLIGNNVYRIMRDLYPNARLKVAVDEYVEGDWHGVKVIRSKDLEKYPDCFVILSTYSGKECGFNVMEKLGRKEYKDFIYLGTING